MVSALAPMPHSSPEPVAPASAPALAPAGSPPDSLLPAPPPRSSALDMLGDALLRESPLFQKVCESLDSLARGLTSERQARTQALLSLWQAVGHTGSEEGAGAPELTAKPQLLVQADSPESPAPVAALRSDVTEVDALLLRLRAIERQMCGETEEVEVRWRLQQVEALCRDTSMMAARSGEATVSLGTRVELLEQGLALDNGDVDGSLNSAPAGQAGELLVSACLSARQSAAAIVESRLRQELLGLGGRLQVRLDSLERTLSTMAPDAPMASVSEEMGSVGGGKSPTTLDARHTLADRSLISEECGIMDPEGSAILSCSPSPCCSTPLQSPPQPLPIGTGSTMQVVPAARRRGPVFVAPRVASSVTEQLQMGSAAPRSHSEPPPEDGNCSRASSSARQGETSSLQRPVGEAHASQGRPRSSSPASAANRGDSSAVPSAMPSPVPMARVVCAPMASLKLHHREGSPPSLRAMACSSSTSLLCPSSPGPGHRLTLPLARAVPASSAQGARQSQGHSPRPFVACTQGNNAAIRYVAIPQGPAVLSSPPQPGAAPASQQTVVRTRNSIPTPAGPPKGGPYLQARWLSRDTMDWRPE